MTEEEFDKMIADHGKDIYRFCVAQTRDVMLGDDLYQDTMLTLWEKRSVLDTLNNPRSYAISVSMRKWKNQKRKYARRHKLAPQVSLDDNDYLGRISDGDLLSENIQNPEDIIIQDETLNAVKNLISELPEKYRQVINLRYAANLSASEIAELMHISVNTIRSRLRKAKQIIKDGLEAYI